MVQQSRTNPLPYIIIIEVCALSIRLLDGTAAKQLPIESTSGLCCASLFGILAFCWQCNLMKYAINEWQYRLFPSKKWKPLIDQNICCSTTYFQSKFNSGQGDSSYGRDFVFLFLCGCSAHSAREFYFQAEIYISCVISFHAGNKFLFHGSFYSVGNAIWRCHKWIAVHEMEY